MTVTMSVPVSFAVSFRMTFAMPVSMVFILIIHAMRRRNIFHAMDVIVSVRGVASVIVDYDFPSAVEVIMPVCDRYGY